MIDIKVLLDVLKEAVDIVQRTTVAVLPKIGISRRSKKQSPKSPDVTSPAGRNELSR